MNRKDKGYIYLGYYCYARQNKRTGNYRLYEGEYSSRTEDRTIQLRVYRDRKKIVEWSTIEGMIQERMPYEIKKRDVKW